MHALLTLDVNPHLLLCLDPGLVLTLALATLAYGFLAIHALSSMTTRLLRDSLITFRTHIALHCRGVLERHDDRSSVH